MRVLQVMAGAAHGGAENFFTRLVLALHEQGLDQQVFMRPDKVREQALDNTNISVTLAPFHAIDFITSCRFRKVIRNYKPDIVLTWMSRASDKCPKGDFVHVARLGGYYDLKYYKKCDHLIGNTRDIQDYFLKEEWPAPYTHYLPNFVDINHAAPAPRHTYDTPPEAPLLFALGRYHDDKAFDVLIKALVHVPHAYLWLAGSGPEEAKLRTLATDNNVQDRIRFIGWQTNPASLYAAADIFICPSRIEPLGNVVLEAWAQGKPVIAAKSSGPKVLITHEHDGLLVEMEDVPGLTYAINRLISDSSLSEKLAQEGFRTLNAKFSKDQVVTQYMDLFQRILKDKRRN